MKIVQIKKKKKIQPVISTVLVYLKTYSTVFVLIFFTYLPESQIIIFFNHILS